MTTSSDSTNLLKNRYANTQIHVDDFVAPGRQRYGIWEPLQLRTRPELELEDGTYDLYTVTSSDLGRIDRIAWRLYQDSTLWWIIAYFNSLANPFEDLVVGMVLKIPRKDTLLKQVQ